jgi:hypothetical protein
LRTSSNIEQIVIEHSPTLFDFCADIHHSIIETHKTINKPVRRSDLWQAVLAGQEKASGLPNTEKQKQPPPGEVPSASRNAGI